MICFGLRTPNLRWCLLSIYFVSGTVQVFSLHFLKSSVQFQKQRNVGFNPSKQLSFPRLLFFTYEMPHASVLPEGTFKSYKYGKHMGVKCQPPELDLVTLQEMNNPPGNGTANILDAAKIIQWANGRTTTFHNPAVHLLYLFVFGFSK